MVETIDLDDGLAIDLGDACPFLDFHLMDQDCPPVAGIIMIERVRQLVRDVCEQCPAQCHIHHLASTADAQERFAIRRGSLDELQLNGITRKVHIVDAGMRIAGEVVEGDVAAARKEKPIQTGVDSIPSILRDQGRDENWHASRLHHRIDVGLHQRNGRMAVYIGGLVGRNSDDWFHGHIVKQKKALRAKPLGPDVS